MQGAILTILIIGLVISSLIGGAILLLLAKLIGKISNATYGNSLLICLISGAIYTLVWYIIGTNALTMGFIGVFIISIIVLSGAYISVGKYIWKCEWIQSIKANAIWILLYAIVMGKMLIK